MKSFKTLSAIALCIVIVFAFCACSVKPGGETAAPSAAPTAEPLPSASPTAEPTPFEVETEPPAVTAEPVSEKYEFDPHLYVPILADEIPQDHWESFYNLCDALRAGESTFECSSEEAYRWATDPAILNALFPVACTKIKGQSSDGSVPFENGVGRIYYQMPIDEYLERQAAFEEMITDILNEHLQSDDDQFEKCLKIFDYIATNYFYQYDFVDQKGDGANYITFLTHEGQCIDLAGVYTYLLLQAGVEAIQVGCQTPDIAHEWVYVIIDGRGYHSDVTWSLKSDGNGADLKLTYFLMSDEQRTDTGCPVDDLTAPLFPHYWVKRSSVELLADDNSYFCPAGSYFRSLDEENKTLYYELWERDFEFHYGHD